MKKRHILKVGGIHVFADYDENECVLTAGTREVQQAKDDLMLLMGWVPFWVRPVVKAAITRLLPAQVTGVTEKDYRGFVRVRVTPETVEIAFRIQPEQFTRHLLVYEAGKCD